jgi:predicted PurR-regulated permease PerM
MSNKENNHSVTINFTNKSVIRVVVIVILAFMFLSFLSKISTALKLIFISGFLAIALNPIVSWFTRHLPKKSRVGATALSYVVVIGFLFGFLFIVVPPFINQMVDLISEIPTSVSDIESQDTALVRFINKHNLTEEFTQVIGELKNNLQALTQRAVSTVTTIGSGIVSFITVLVMTFMMLIEGPRWVQRYVNIQPKSKVDKRIEVLKDMYRLVTGYVNGQLLIALIAAIFAFFALVITSTIMEVSVNAIALASIVGLIGLIPMIGNTIAAVIVVLFCLFISAPLAIVMAIFFLVYQQIENATLQPFIQAKYNELTPLTVFVAAIIGVSVAGFLGALVAIPVAGCLRIYLMAYYGDKLALKNNEKFST